MYMNTLFLKTSGYLLVSHIDPFPSFLVCISLYQGCNPLFKILYLGAEIYCSLLYIPAKAKIYNIKYFFPTKSVMVGSPATYNEL